MSRQRVLTIAEYDELCSGKPPGFKRDLDAIARIFEGRVLIDEDQFWAVCARYFWFPEGRRAASCC